MKRKQPVFVAEYMHEAAPVDQLAEVLDRYEALCGTVAEPAAGPTLAEQEQFVVDWVAEREHRLRGALEEVVWELEKRDHPAWLEDIGSDVVEDLVSSGDGVMHEARPLGFRFTVAGSSERESAPELRFIPDPAISRVHIDAWFGDPRTSDPVRIGPDIRLELLTERLIVEIATEFVFDVLRRHEPALERPAPAEASQFSADAPPLAKGRGLAEPRQAPPPPPPPPPVVHEHQWSDPGILHRWVDKRRTNPALPPDGPL